MDNNCQIQTKVLLFLFAKFFGLNKAQGNAGYFFFCGERLKDDRIRDGFEISCVSLPQLQYSTIQQMIGGTGMSRWQ